MVMPLGPGKFYGSSLPRPRFYSDVKNSDERVDPPLPVMDPLLSWAQDAHWSMGGLSFRRQRLQGRIEGSIKRLRAERDAISTGQRSAPAQIKSERGGRGKSLSPDSAPPAPLAAKRRRYMALVDEDDEELEADGGSDSVEVAAERGAVRRGPVRKLKAEFDRVAAEEMEVGRGKGKGSPSRGNGIESIASRTRSQRSGKEGEAAGSKKGKRLMKGGKLVKSEGNEENSGSAIGGLVRTSPRLKKLG